MAARVTALERDVKKAITDLLDAERIPWFRMNAGDRFGSYKGKKWRIVGHPTGTADILAIPKIEREFPFGSYRLCGLDGRPVRVPVMLWIETKATGKTQSEAQVRFEMECLQRGHAYLVADDVDKVEEWLKEHGGIQ